MEKKTTPNYKKIYTDLVEMKYPHKRDECAFFLKKKYLEVMDVIHLNDLLFRKKNKERQEIDKKQRSYDESTIFRILNYQKKHQLNNSELANHFKISRNTVAKWKKIFD
jgi:DNA-binding transcriptional regulator YiaG